MHNRSAHRTRPCHQLPIRQRGRHRQDSSCQMESYDSVKTCSYTTLQLDRKKSINKMWDQDTEQQWNKCNYYDDLCHIRKYFCRALWPNKIQWHTVTVNNDHLPSFYFTAFCCLCYQLGNSSLFYPSHLNNQIRGHLLWKNWAFTTRSTQVLSTN